MRSRFVRQGHLERYGQSNPPCVFNTRGSPQPSLFQTKHFQTLFWTPDVRLVDCPGLVMPNFVPMETQVRVHHDKARKCDGSSHRAGSVLQVLSGILPISKVSAIPACIHYASQLLPLEQVFNLKHPTLSTPAVEDKRTWREPKSRDPSEKPKSTWTAMDVLTAYADAKSWVTARAGRPDVNRAGNAGACIFWQRWYDGN